jgi:hypothetical protein
VVMLIQYLADPTPLLGGDVPSYHVFSQPIHPMVEEVVMSMQSSVDPTLLLESVESTKVVTPDAILLIPLFSWRVSTLPKWSC